MDGRRYPRVLGILNGALRFMLWTVPVFTVLVFLGVFAGYVSAAFVPAMAWPFLTAVSVLAILYTLDALVAAVQAVPDATAESLRRTAKPKPSPPPPPVPTSSQDGWDMAVDAPGPARPGSRGLRK
jgi:hypothetical protein